MCFPCCPSCSNAPFCFKSVSFWSLNSIFSIKYISLPFILDIYLFSVLNLSCCGNKGKIIGCLYAIIERYPCCCVMKRRLNTCWVCNFIKKGNLHKLVAYSVSWEVIGTASCILLRSTQKIRSMINHFYVRQGRNSRMRVCSAVRKPSNTKSSAYLYT